MLRLRLELLTGRYTARCFDDPNAVEWPPHPARVYSALVAAHYEGERSEEGEAALRWLESLPAPSLWFSLLAKDRVRPRDVKTNFVPVNDKALSDAATVSTAWKRLSAASTDKARAKAEKGLHAAYAKVGSEATKLNKDAASKLAHVLPDSRTKQPRTFPTVVPEDPVVEFGWDVEPTPTQLTGLGKLTRYLVRVGHSSSFVSGSWETREPERPASWVARPDGAHLLRWVQHGQLDALNESHERQPFAEQRMLPYTPVPYGPATTRGNTARSVFDHEMIVLRRESGPRVGSLGTERVAESVRKAIMSHAAEPIASLISGHHGGESDAGNHLAIVPLPRVDDAYAKGDILGIAIVIPRSASADERTPLYRAIRNWENASPDSTAELRMGRVGVWQLRRETEASVLINLRPRTWTRPSRVWVTATPIILDRRPGNLDAQKPGRRRGAQRKAREFVALACHRAGVDVPVSVELSSDPLLPGSSHCAEFRHWKNPDDSRPYVHARLEFAEPVQGPLLLGAGRFRGLGLLRPQHVGEENSDDRSS